MYVVLYIWYIRYLVIYKFVDCAVLYVQFVLCVWYITSASSVIP